jgi:hypothetical protein
LGGQRNIKTQRDKKRETEKQNYRYRETEIQGRKRESRTEKWIYKQTDDRETDKQKKTEKHRHREIDREMGNILGAKGQK